MNDGIIDLEDVSDFMRLQREHTRPAMYAQLITPREMVYPVIDSTIAARLGICRIMRISFVALHMYIRNVFKRLFGTIVAWSQKVILQYRN